MMIGPRHLSVLRMILLVMILLVAYEVKLSAAIDCSLTDCYEGDDGKNYRGSKSTTRSGLRCQAWASQKPHQHRFSTAKFRNLDLVSNYCRNPNGEYLAPFCLTTTRRRWEYCLSKCKDNMGPSAVTSGTKWFCAVKGTQVVKVARELKVAQMALAEAGSGQSQAIIPMTAVSSGDPHSLAKNWQGGNMWWYDWPDIINMQVACRNACPLITTTRAPPTTTKPATTKVPTCELVYDEKRKKQRAYGRAPRGRKRAYTRQVNVPQGVVNQGQAKIEGFCNDKCLSTYRDNGLNRCRYVRAGCVGQGYWGYWGDRSTLTNCKCDLWLGVTSDGTWDIGGTWYKCRN